MYSRNLKFFHMILVPLLYLPVIVVYYNNAQFIGKVPIKFHKPRLITLQVIWSNKDKSYLTPFNSVKIGTWLIVYNEFILVRLCRKLFSLYRNTRIRSWNQPVLSNECKVSCSRKQRLGPDWVWTHVANDP